MMIASDDESKFDRKINEVRVWPIDLLRKLKKIVIVYCIRSPQPVLGEKWHNNHNGRISALCFVLSRME